MAERWEQHNKKTGDQRMESKHESRGLTAVGMEAKVRKSRQEANIWDNSHVSDHVKPGSVFCSVSNSEKIDLAHQLLHFALLYRTCENSKHSKRKKREFEKEAKTTKRDSSDSKITGYTRKTAKTVKPEMENGRSRENSAMSKNRGTKRKERNTAFKTQVDKASGTLKHT